MKSLQTTNGRQTPDDRHRTVADTYSSLEHSAQVS